MQTPSIVLWLAAAILAAILFRLLFKKKTDSNEKASEIDQREKDLEERFYAAIRNGDRPRNIARIYSQMDLALLRSILSSKNITSFASNQNMNNLRTGAAIQGYNDTVLVVLESDYANAKDILIDYIDNRKKSSGKASAATKLRNITETALAGAFMNPNERLPELME